MSFKPPKPITKQPIPEGYDAQLYGWIEHLEAREKADVLKLYAALKKVAGGSGAVASGYDGPFAVVNSSTESTQQITVYSQNAEEGRPAAATVTLGTTVKTFAETTLSVSASGYVYLKITYSGSAYIVETASAASMPAQAATEYYVPLAYVTVTDGAISDIQQLQFGQVEGAGRIL